MPCQILCQELLPSTWQNCWVVCIQ